MMKLSPYIMFAGNAEEALHMYVACFDGEIKDVQRYGEAPMPSPDEVKNKLVHASFVFGDNTIMMSDSMPGKEPSGGGSVHLSVDINDPVKMETIFNSLAQGGTITMPLQDTFWGARFGMLTDRFGIHWMFNCEASNKQEHADR